MNNKNAIILCVALTILYTAELLLMDGVGVIKYFLILPFLLDAVGMSTNTEWPIQAGKFWGCLLLMLAPMITVISIWESVRGEIK